MTLSAVRPASNPVEMVLPLFKSAMSLSTKSNEPEVMLAAALKEAAVTDELNDLLILAVGVEALAAELCQGRPGFAAPADLRPDLPADAIAYVVTDKDGGSAVLRHLRFWTGGEEHFAEDISTTQLVVYLR